MPSVPGLSNSKQSDNPQASKDSVMEGWRAVLTVVLRYGLGQKQTPERDVFSSEKETNKNMTDAMEVDSVRAMVAGVKTRGVSYCFAVHDNFSSDF